MLSGLSTMIGVLALLVGVANTIWSWLAKGQTATSDRMKKAEDEHGKLELRVLQLEGDYKHLPTKDDISGLKVQLQDVLGQVRNTQSELVSVNRTVGRIDDFLREKA